MDKFTTDSEIVASSKLELCENWQSYLRDFANWKWFLTLTTRDILTRDQIEHLWFYLVRVMNSDLFGHHYTRIVGHSYFSYCVGFEYQQRGALHLHALVDQNINLNLVHAVWKKMAGFAWVRPVDDLGRAVDYLAKYVSKGGDLSLYRCPVVKQPPFTPYWYDPETIDPEHLFR